MLILSSLVLWSFFKDCLHVWSFFELILNNVLISNLLLSIFRLAWQCPHWATTPCFLITTATLSQCSSNEVWMSHCLRMIHCKFTWQKNHWWKNTALLLRYSLFSSPFLFCNYPCTQATWGLCTCVFLYKVFWNFTVREPPTVVSLY